MPKGIGYGKKTGSNKKKQASLLFRLLKGADIHKELRKRVIDSVTGASPKQKARDAARAKALSSFKSRDKLHRLVHAKAQRARKRSDTFPAHKGAK